MFPLPLPRLFHDPGRCAKVVPGLLRAWVPARVMVDQEHGSRLMVGLLSDLRPISERQCYPEALSVPADLWWRVRFSRPGMALKGPRVGVAVRIVSPAADETGRASEAELRGGIVVPRLGHPDVLAQRGQGPVSGLMGDGAVRRPSEVGVGDEAGAKTVRGVGGRIKVGPSGGLLDQHVH